MTKLQDRKSAKVAKASTISIGLAVQHIIRTVVRRIEIDATRIEIIFRVPPPDGPPGPRSPIKTTDSWQRCTGVGREDLRLDQS